MLNTPSLVCARLQIKLLKLVKGLKTSDDESRALYDTMSAELTMI